jgi:LacI family transcriptional regulator
MKKKKSIHDLAKDLNISATTISFVLNGRAEEMRISSAVTKKILKHVKEVGYHPNLVAKSLRTGQSKTIGMLVEGISDHFFAGIARGVEEEAYKTGYKIFNSSTDNDTAKAKELIKAFRERQVDGYIIAPSPGIEEDIKALIDENYPVIIFDRYFPNVNSNIIIVDNYGGAYKAIIHLIENGFKNIAFVTIDSVQIQMEDRLKGYVKAIEENGLTKSIFKIPFPSIHDEIAEKVKIFFKANSNLDAVLFATNYLAIGGLKAINELGMKIPSDIAVIGFDENYHFSLFTPAITCVSQPVEEIARQIVIKLMASLVEENRRINLETIVLPTNLIIRESSHRKSVKRKTN